MTDTTRSASNKTDASASASECVALVDDISVSALPSIKLKQYHTVKNKKPRKGGGINPVGRKGKFDTYVRPKLDLVQQWVTDGLQNKQIAQNLGINESTLYDYLTRYEELRQTFQKGLDGRKFQLENALFKKAVGYTATETKVEKNADGTEKVTTTEKQIAPSDIALIFALKNVYSEKYKDRVEQTTTIDININKLEQLSDEQLAKYIDIPTDYKVE